MYLNGNKNYYFSYCGRKCYFPIQHTLSSFLNDGTSLIWGNNAPGLVSCTAGYGHVSRFWLMRLSGNVTRDFLGRLLYVTGSAGKWNLLAPSHSSLLLPGTLTQGLSSHSHSRLQGHCKHGSCKTKKSELLKWMMALLRAQHINTHYSYKIKISWWGLNGSFRFCFPKRRAHKYIIAKNGKQTRCSLIGKCRNKLWYIRTGEHYIAINRNRLRSHKKT